MTSFEELPMSCDQANGSKSSARIFNIQRYSLHDGTGIRTVVFFKGCPLSCPWCANPESRSHKITYMRRKALCLECDECEMDVEECPSGAYEQVGTDMTLNEVIAQVAKDDVFFNTSNGGITLSGGEILTQAHFAIELLTKLKQLGYRTAVETSGHGNSTQLSRIGELCDEVLFDFKIMDAQKAKSVIGLNVEKVLGNFKMLVEQKCNVIPRLPLIPGYTLDLINIESVLRFLKPFNIREIHLLPFHQYGANKYETLGMEYLMKDIPVPTQSEVEAIRSHIQASGYQVVIGG
ncbi:MULTISPECIES: [formate-C-acetyltransferase]-activating enzyme [Vibrio]|uniref:[formate-C-acetyltransferase]-activating enzyme n=2 Tax=Vibrionaceae TaxID=641 RepID=A0A8B3EFS2_VIBHA|nr:MULTISPECIES: [formate-C-acetyltransferase]-activating enzyme [Vibrio]EKO3834813.1 [formate-C-acetyltransferase]-activating enzyme [Vibrio harveyi]RIW16746.1 [formate-C-acetyltransferase]-activating enzyme [Vibrio harveyi]HDM8125356.1 [formate-C-acetyltransferase]-activating enzyme [Vibrio harveyi]